MRDLRSAGRADLAAIVAATLIAICVALFADSGPLVTAALLPLVLILPGYALTAALFPPKTIGRDLRAALTVALSISATALSGLLLQVFVDLSRGVVIASLAAVTLAAATVAWRGRDAAPDKEPTAITWPRLHPVSVLAVLAAVAICGIAIAIATTGAKSQLDDSHFSALWLLPRGAPSHPGRPPVIVGVSNQEGRNFGYRLRVSEGATTIGAWRFRLAGGGEWKTVLPASVLPATGPLVASLGRAGKPFRRVALRFESEPSTAANG